MPSTAARKSDPRCLQQGSSRASSRRLRGAWSILGAALLCACAASGPEGAGRHEQRPPLTDLDPEPYHPQPSSTPGAGGVRALSVSSHADSALQLALEFISAVRVADLTRARSLMADDMFRVGERGFYRPMSANVAMAQLRRALSTQRAAGARPGPLNRLLQVQQAEVGPPRPSTVHGPRGLRPSDTLVTFPTTPEGRVELARWYPGWSTRVRILVRTAGTPRVIGF